LRGHQIPTVVELALDVSRGNRRDRTRSYLGVRPGRENGNDKGCNRWHRHLCLVAQHPRDVVLGDVRHFVRQH